MKNNVTKLKHLVGQNVTLFCLNYFYTGKLVNVNKKCAILKAAKIVYETGELKASSWQDAQELPGDWYVKTDAIESFGLMGRDA